MSYNNEKTVIDLSDAVSISDLVIKISSVIDSDGIINKSIHLNLGGINLKQSQLLSIKALIETMQSRLVSIQTKSDMTEASAIGLGLEVSTATTEVRPTYNDVFKSEPQLNNIPQTQEINSFAQLKKMNSIGDFVTDAQTLSEVQPDASFEQETKEFLAEAETEEITEEYIEETFSTASETNIYETLDQETNVTHSDEVQSALDLAFGALPQQNISDNVLFDTPSAPQTMQEKFDDYEVTETVEKTEEDKYILLDTEGITPEGVELIKSNTSDLPTLYLTQTLRSGQTVSYEGNIFLIGDAHPGSEVNATGDVTVWGILGGIVHAGSKGNTDAKVRALKLNPIQLRIANLYSRRNDTVNVPYVQKTNEFTPEEARIENNQIVIYKTLRRED